MERSNMADFITFRERNPDNKAEVMAEKWLNHRQLNYTRYGLDCPNSGFAVWNIPEFVRLAPDFIVFMGEKNDKPLFLEAKCYSNMLKLKHRDMKSYWHWNEHMPLIMLFYNTNSKEYCEMLYDDVINIVKTKDPDVGVYAENINNYYYKIKTEWLSDFTKR